ncbi:methionyl-tRNA formyltransferase [Deinococcus roseus]|uniref:Methionyl-tRNA formyltransferase n=1 Tax=Deinococcus roseus TaxID=392414 RepID=A0ABQ2CYK6_9DEIO|nr:methionyl-tRNA formyltransferase [Deinococcus roseus]GGJ33550.1 methionyl-tRNA formyltransferase [Deinococcus roseus]
MNRKKVAFFGSPAFALPVMEAIRQHHDIVLVVSQPDKPVGRGNKITPPPVAARAKELGLPLSQPVKLRKNQDFLEELKNSGAEVAVTCAYGKILPQNVLDAPRYGFINTHTSLLPRYRGAAPIQWALIEGEAVTGTTIMQTDAGMDTGDILIQQELPIEPNWTLTDLAQALSDQASTLIVQALDQLDTLVHTPQNHEAATHARMLEKEDGEIRWFDSLSSIVNRYRGTYGWPGSYTHHKGKRLKVLELRASDAPKTAEPGHVQGTTATGVLVACSDGVLELLQVQPESKAALSGADWIKNHQVKIGEKLGQ